MSWSAPLLSSKPGQSQSTRSSTLHLEGNVVTELKLSPIFAIWIKNYSFSTIQVRCEQDFWTDDGVFTFLTPGRRCGWSRYTGDKNLIIREQGVEWVEKVNRPFGKNILIGYFGNGKTRLRYVDP